MLLKTGLLHRYFPIFLTENVEQLLCEKLPISSCWIILIYNIPYYLKIAVHQYSKTIYHGRCQDSGSAKAKKVLNVSGNNAKKNFQEKIHEKVQFQKIGRGMTPYPYQFVGVPVCDD